MANDLKVELGEYHHHAGSMHIYERHYKMANNILKDGVEYYKQKPNKIVLNQNITSEYIMKRDLFLHDSDMTKDKILHTSKNLRKVLIKGL
jgi:thymidylate synthase